MVNIHVSKQKDAIRVFTLGVGSTVSHSLIDGIARAGNGFSQSVCEGEQMDKKIIRMLKASLTPHILDYTLEIKYKKSASSAEGDFELVEKIHDALTITDAASVDPETPRQPMSLFDPSIKNGNDLAQPQTPENRERFQHVPPLEAPRYLQAPLDIPPLFPFVRTTVYVLLSDLTPEQVPESVILKGRTAGTVLDLEIPITLAADSSTTMHQLAARKAIKELEEGRGWIYNAKNSGGDYITEAHEGHYPDMVEREAVRIGLLYEVAGKWTSFVAIDGDNRIEETIQTSLRSAGSEINSTTAPQEVPQFRGLTVPVHHTADVLNDFDFDSFLNDSTEDHFDFNSVFGSQERISYPCVPSPAMDDAIFIDRQRAESPSKKASLARPSTPNVEDTRPRKRHAKFGKINHTSPDSRLGNVMSSLAADTGYPSNESSMSRVAQHQAVHSSLSYGEGPNREGSALSSPQYPTDRFARLVDLLRFNGQWEWSATLSSIIGVAENEIVKIRLPGNAGKKKDILATACAVVYLKTKLASERDSWEMLVNKARQWLEYETGTPADELEKLVQGLIT